MKWLNKILSLKKAKQSSSPMFLPQTGMFRGYMAASNDRLMDDLKLIETPDISGNMEIRHVLRRLRARSRALANNSEYFQNAISLLQKGIVGANGMNLQMRIYKSESLVDLDVKANQTIEEHWRKFSTRKNFSADQSMNRASFERALVRNLVTDGEVIIEKIFGRKYEYGVSFRIIDPDLLDETLILPENSCVANSDYQPAKGNRVIMGVEVDPVGKPEAYWFKEIYPGEETAGRRNAFYLRRIPADRIIHTFVREKQRVGMTRGVPWLVSGIRRIAMLNGFEEAALVNARYGASKMLFYKQPALTDSEEAAGMKYEDDREKQEKLDDYLKSNLRTEMEAGTLGILPSGWSIEQFNPNYPNQETDPFVKGQVRAFSAGAGLNYTTLSGDLAEVSLSSLRQGANTDRDTYESLQNWFNESIETEIFETFLSTGLDFSRIGTLPSSAFERLNRPVFMSRQFRSPDPQKDVAADAQAVSLGIKSRHQICAERGQDFEETLDQLAREKELMQEKGITETNVNPESHKNPPAESQEGEN